MGIKRSRWTNALGLSFCLWSLLFFANEHPSYSVHAQTAETGQEQPRDLIQSHDNTNFPLVGRHRTVECGECHLNGLIQGTPQTCETCHWVRRQDDRYRLQLGNHCEECHTPQSWKKIVGGPWDHELRTGFRLEVAHRAAECADCHDERGFAGISSDCSTCHLDDYNQTTSPNHRQAGFPTNCDSCHSRSANTWQGAILDHDRRFPLRGQHQALDCEACHGNGVFAGTPQDCSACHRDDYNRTTDPNHQQSGFPLDCESCHGSSANGWSGASFDHSRFFPLQGAHRSLDCDACHVRGYNLPRDCFGCHAQDYQAARNPDHVASGFPSNCEQCHFPNHTRWSQAVFNHRFPLTGPHNRDCSECHISGNLRQFSCTVCHEPDRTNRDHDEVNGYVYDSQACYSCHPSGRED